MLDLVIRNGLVVDGSGGQPFAADVGIRDGIIVEVGRITADAVEEIDARGHIVTPGFVDIHTHYDGQVIWDTHLRASSAHGVTTVVTGNCGVGFAPCRATDRERMYALMEGVEDIPEVVMAKGLTWEWESFPEYLDAIERRPHDIDVAAMLPHSPMRVYVMGERGANREPATDDDMARMKDITREAMEVGALGFGTSRLILHRTREGSLIPSYDAGAMELNAIMSGIRESGRGVVQAVLNLGAGVDFDKEFGVFTDMVTNAERPASYSLAQTWDAPDLWKRALELTEEANDKGLEVRAQVIGRPTGLLYGLDLSFHPFCRHPSYMEIADLPLAERVARMRAPQLRERILADEQRADDDFPLLALLNRFEWMFPMGDPPIYEPAPELSIAAQAQAQGRTPYEVVYDLLLEDDGQAIIFQAVANYVEGNLNVVREMLSNRHTLLGLGDGGAHYGVISDSSYPTFMLTYWGRDRKDSVLSVQEIVRKLTADPAHAVGLHDRGHIAAGYKADLNVIDFDKLRLAPPQVHHDLPAGGKRLMQGARGFRATIVSGVIIQRDGEATDALPGRLVRGAQPVPA
ncbi:amidohydrolase family protein [Sphingobium sp. EM0848]|uniref:N-acyl-D-amino-acid deacylase family protein n=1 Tax=Sphingobium sp. EM0848 TaxID=2743473 RepID=UPI00159C694C